MDIKYSNIPNVCFSLTSKDDSREELFIKQRQERGFDDSETWCLTSSIVSFTLPRLKRFKEISPNNPLGLSKEAWNEILDKMIKSFELIIRDRGSRIFTEEENIQVEEGLDLFREYFIALWW